MTNVRAFALRCMPYVVSIPLWWAAYYLATTFLTHIPWVINNKGMFDFPIFLQYAHQYIANGHLYNEDITQYWPGAPIYKFPPLMGAVLVHFLQQGTSEDALFLGMALCQIAAFFAAALICLKALPNTRQWLAAPVSLAITLAYMPLLEDNVLRLQLEPFLLLMFAGALYCLQRRCIFWAGAIIGLAAMLKVYPALFGLYFLLTRRWAALAGMVAAGIVVSMYTLWMLGVNEHIKYFVEILPILLRENVTGSLENLSIGNYVNFFGGTALEAQLVCQATLWLCLLLSVWLIFRARKVHSAAAKEEATALVFSAFALVPVIGMANSWWNYQILLLIPIYIIVAVIARNLRNNLVSLLIFSATCVMLWLAATPLWRESLLGEGDIFFRLVFFRGIATWLIFCIVIKLHMDLDRGVTRPPG